MKQNKIKLSKKRGEIYLTVSFGMSLICRGKGENEWFMWKRNDCWDSFIELAF